MREVTASPWPPDTPPDAVEELEERAAIIEHDGHRSRREAEREAWRQVMRKEDGRWVRR